MSAPFSFLLREVAEVASSPGPCFSVVTGKVAPFTETLVLGASLELCMTELPFGGEVAEVKAQR